MASSRRSPPIHGRRASGDKRKQFRNFSKESTRERPSATARHIPTNGKHSSRFARGAVFAEFRRRDARALDYDGFADHDPDAALQDADKIISGRVAITRLLKLAIDTDGEEAETAFERADELRRILHLEISRYSFDL